MQASALYKQAYEVRVQKLGADHRDTKACLEYIRVCAPRVELIQSRMDGSSPSRRSASRTSLRTSSSSVSGAPKGFEALLGELGVTPKHGEGLQRLLEELSPVKKKDE